jgi:hypothetical protein
MRQPHCCAQHQLFGSAYVAESIWMGNACAVQDTKTQIAAEQPNPGIFIHGLPYQFAKSLSHNL